MRLSTAVSAAILALSTAAIAQVGQTPEEQKLGPNAATPDNMATPANAPIGNAATPSPGAPSTALVNSADGRGQLPPK